jgi:hypothetical protein
MKFGKVFRYLAKLSNGEIVVWRVFAETRTEADAKVGAYLDECTKNGFYNVPVTIDFASTEDNLVLY